MKRNLFDQLVRMRTLEQMSPLGLGGTFDPGEHAPDHVVKNVCAKVSTDLARRINDTVALVGCSKRQFLEAAFIAACDRVEEIQEQEGFHDWLAENSDVVEVSRDHA